MSEKKTVSFLRLEDDGAPLDVEAVEIVPMDAGRGFGVSVAPEVPIRLVAQHEPVVGGVQREALRDAVDRVVQ